MQPLHWVKLSVTATAVRVTDFRGARRDQRRNNNLSGDGAAAVCAGNGDGEYLSDLILPGRRRGALFSTPNYTCFFQLHSSECVHTEAQRRANKHRRAA